MSVKIYDREQKKWIIFPGTIGAPGKDAYLIAQENGYTGTKEEYTKVLTDIPELINSIEKKPTEGSENLVTSGGVWQAIEDVYTTVDDQINVVSTQLDINTEDISNIKQDITNIRTTEISDQIKSSIIDNLESLAADKSLSANQGRVLKEMIANLANLRIEVVDQLPSTGETNVIYLVKKVGSDPDIHDEYVFVNGKWEKIGNTDIDLSNYYTKQEVDDKLSDVGLGDVLAAAPFTTADRVITSNSAGKVVKDSGILISNLALKTDITWNSIQNKPSTFTPSAHSHVLADITDAGTLAGKDKVDESDLSFNIPEGVVVDSVLSTTSENPVQNKVITTQLNNKVNNSTLSNYVKTVDLNTTLGNYYLKTETYTKSEVDEKIGSAGGGDVMASNNLIANNIILGAGTKSIKDSGITLNSLATQEWVQGQGYLTSVPALPIASRTVAGIVTTEAQDFAGEKTFYGGIAAQDADLANLIVSNTLELNGERFDYQASSAQYGGLKVGYTGSIPNIPLQLDNTGKAYVKLTTDAIMMGLGGINGRPQLTKTTITKGTGDITIKEEFDDVENIYNYTLSIPDIPSIPIALPNPYSLSITANNSTSTYTGSSAVNINLDNFFSKKLPILTNPDDAGKPGIFFTTNGTTQVTIAARVTKDQPDAIVVVPGTTPIVIDEPTTFVMQDIDSLLGSVSASYKCFCISWVAPAQTGLREDLILVNGALYG